MLVKLEQEPKQNPKNLPIIEETSLHHIVLRVRDWQEAIDKKFGKEKSYLDFENDEVNEFKKKLLEKGEIDENGNPVDRFYEGVDYEMKRFQLVKNPKSDEWLDISSYCESESFEQIDIKNCYWEEWNISKDKETGCYYNIKIENVIFLKIYESVSDEKEVFHKIVTLEMVGCRVLKEFKITNFSFKGLFTIINCFLENVTISGNHFLYFKIIRSSVNYLKFENNITEQQFKLDGLLMKNAEFFDSYFRRESFINIKFLDGEISFNNTSIDTGDIESEDENFGKMFRDSFVKEFKILEVSKDSIVSFNYCDFSNFQNWKNTLFDLKSTKNLEIIIGNNCDPKPFQKVLSFKSNKKVASFMKDFGVAFETWTRIEKNEDVFVSVEATSSGYNVIFESSSEFAIDNIERYKQDFQDTISDKNKLNELKKKADDDDFNELISQIFKILSKQAAYQGNLDTNSLFQLQANPNQLILQFMQLNQHNHDNSQGNQSARDIINPIQNNNSSAEEIIQILDKILKYQPENDAEKNILENVIEAKQELQNNNPEEAKKLLSLKKVWNFIKNPVNQVALGLATNGIYDVLKMFVSNS